MRQSGHKDVGFPRLHTSCCFRETTPVVQPFNDRHSLQWDPRGQGFEGRGFLDRNC